MGGLPFDEADRQHTSGEACREAASDAHPEKLRTHPAFGHWRLNASCRRSWTWQEEGSVPSSHKLPGLITFVQDKLSERETEREIGCQHIVGKAFWPLPQTPENISVNKKVRKVPSYGRKRLLGNAATTPPLSRSEIYLFFGWVFK